MPTRNIRSKDAALQSLRNLTYIAIALAIIAIAMSGYSLMKAGKPVYLNRTVYVNGTKTANTIASYVKYNITSSLITPQYYLPKDPPITNATNATFGSTLAGLNTQLNASQLSIINNASLSNYEKAGMMYLNGSFGTLVDGNANNVPQFVVNGKPSVIYFGSITCVFCGENRWAMALALSRFGNFSTLFFGYSSIGDHDVPTIYWAPAQYNESGDDLGSFYNSRYINFIAIEDTDPITGGFNLNSFPQIRSRINYTVNLAYEDAISYILNLSNVPKTAFQGTPYTIWGASQMNGADSIDFGNTTGAQLGITTMTHQQILNEIANPSNQFGWLEYAGADIYIAMTCASINNSAPVCSLPAIRGIEKQNGY